VLKQKVIATGLAPLFDKVPRSVPASARAIIPGALLDYDCKPANVGFSDGPSKLLKSIKPAREV
jgi:hypothetical protein